MEKDWRELFTEAADEKVTFPTEPGECSSNCQLAKEIKCAENGYRAKQLRKCS
jgi:hypothetical protein